MAKGGRAELMALLQKLSIDTKIVEHPAVFTVETMMPHLEHLEGLVTKNLFMKDKKKKLYLLTALHSSEVKLNDIAKKVDAKGGLRLADESIMIEKLGVAQGCCTPLSLFNDEAKDVHFICDSILLDENQKMVFSHPMENTATVGMSIPDFKKFLAETGHDPISIEF